MTRVTARAQVWDAPSDYDAALSQRSGMALSVEVEEHATVAEVMELTGLLPPAGGGGSGRSPGGRSMAVSRYQFRPQPDMVRRRCGCSCGKLPRAAERATHAHTRTHIEP